MSDELKPCPFCGTTDRLEVRRPMQPAASDYRAVWCDRCGFWGPRGQDAAAPHERGKPRPPRIDARLSAIEAWNRRACPPRPAAVVRWGRYKAFWAERNFDLFEDIREAQAFADRKDAEAESGEPIRVIFQTPTSWTWHPRKPGEGDQS